MKLNNETAFYDAIRENKLLGPTLSDDEFDGLKNIVNAGAEANWPASWVAYALATAYHETAHTMQPLKEYGGNSYYMRLYDISGKDPARAKSMGNTSVGDGAKYCGRGYVQLTWKSNYAKAGKNLGIDLVGNPDLTLKSDVAAKVMVLGMENAWFTRHSLKSTIPSPKGTYEQFVEARRIINGQDKAKTIAGYALEFQEALIKGDYK